MPLYEVRVTIERLYAVRAGSPREAKETVDLKMPVGELMLLESRSRIDEPIELRRAVEPPRDPTLDTKAG